MHPLVEKVRALRRQLIGQRVAFGLFATGATFLSAALAMGLLDSLVRFEDRGLQLMATAVVLLALAAAAYRWVYKPSLRAITPLEVGRRIERQFPELRDALSSSIEFLHQAEDDPTLGSPQMRRHVVNEVHVLASQLDLHEIVDRRPLVRSATAFGVAVSVALMLFVFSPQAWMIAAQRLAWPLGSTEWPRKDYLTFLDVPSQLAAGQTFEVELINESGRLPEDVRIELRSTDKTNRHFSTIPTTRVDDIIRARVENVQQSFSFRAEGGDDRRMAWHHVEVVAPPQLESLTTTVHPPAYSRLPSRPATPRMHVLEGSQIEVQGRSKEQLTRVRILNPSGRVAAELKSESEAGLGTSFHIEPEQWLIEKPGLYRLELATVEGPLATVHEWTVSVATDVPPTIQWQQPADDLYVLAQAVVPVEFMVQDDLGVQRVVLAYDIDREQPLARETNDPQAVSGQLELYHDTTGHAPRIDAVLTAAGTLELATLGVADGEVVLAHGLTTDNKSQTGRTSSARRITIISRDELDLRLADRQREILRILQRAAADQHDARTAIGQLEAIRPADSEARRNRPYWIEAAEIRQQQVRRSVGSAQTLARESLNEIDINRLVVASMRERIGGVAGALATLEGALQHVERELTSVRKMLQATAGTNGAPPETALQLSTVGAAQDQILSEINALIEALSEDAQYERLASQLAELRRLQLDQLRQTQSVPPETASLRPEELGTADRARLEALTAEQSGITERYRKMERQMETLWQTLENEQSSQALAVEDVLSIARKRNVRAMSERAADDLSANRVGRALDEQESIGNALREMIDVLKQPTPTDDPLLARDLRAAEARLRSIREAVQRLRADSDSVQKDSENADAAQQYRRRRRDIQDNTAELAQNLEKLGARDASRSTQRASDHLAPSVEHMQSERTQRSSLKLAEQELSRAARSLEAARQEAEHDLQLEFVRRFEAELREMVDRQRQVLKATAQLDSGTVDHSADATTVEQLVDEERQLAALALEHSQVLHGLSALRLGLEEAHRRLIEAAEQLAARGTGPPTQRAERSALARLENMLEAFSEASHTATNSPGGGESANSAQSERRPTFELLELKMLRMLQEDLNRQTSDLRAQAADSQANAEKRSKLAHEAEQLSAEQRRLAELVQEMLERNNESPSLP